MSERLFRYLPMFPLIVPTRTILFHDTFNRANGPLGTSDSGHTWQLASGGTPLLIDNNLVKTQNSTSGMPQYVDVGATNYKVSVDFANCSAGIGLYLKYANATNRIYVVASGGSSGFYIYQNLDSTSITTIKSSGLQYTEGSNVHVEMTINNGEITFQYNYGTVYTYSYAYGNYPLLDNATNVAIGVAGGSTSTSRTNLRWDNLKVETI